MKPIIRQAIIGDLPEIYSNELAYIKEIEPENETRWVNSIPNHLKQWIQMIPNTYVISNEIETLGHCSWVVKDGKALLCSIYIMPQYRRQGLAFRLLSHFESAALNSGFKESTLGVYIHNPAENLYLVTGYQFINKANGYNYYVKELIDAN